ncbi:MAG: 50S ribosomal protein L21e [Candidatus Diapherotrites archaeon]
MASKKAKGKRAKSRDKGKRRRTRATVNKKLRNFRKGCKVTLMIDSSIHSGMPPMRYHGLTGTVQGKRGSVFLIELKDGNLSKFLLVHPAHLNAAKAGGSPVKAPDGTTAGPGIGSEFAA